ncbi:uncharacterized protein LOC131597468 [Vicia villosa]|uniref:uncharacterized protein LOC131597468 n=1 Tax=Vicia villosa TaxID=3911 RepID=UPI00273A87D0|nr:uncharacterized protein LOC131597468 [Vicia villosa]
MAHLRRCPNFTYHPKCARLHISNICFADELLLFARGDEASIQTMMHIFQQFSEATSLKANPTKCKAYFGGTCNPEKRRILTATSFKEGELPFKYLGVPLSSRRLSINQCQPLIDKVLNRIQHWSAKLLSYAGRQQLVKSVLLTISGYWMQVFPIPKKVITAINSICKNFLWSGKATSRKALVAWGECLRP